MKLKPWQRAKKWQLENSEVPFEELLEDFLNSGLVYSSDSEFLLAKKVLWEGETMYYGDVEGNCWFVQLAAADPPFSRLIARAPYPLEYIAWQRRGKEEYHVHRTEDFNKKVEVKNG